MANSSSTKQGFKGISNLYCIDTANLFVVLGESFNASTLKSTNGIGMEKEKDVLEKHLLVDLEVHLIPMFAFKYWQIASGQYAIGDPKLGGLFSLDNAGPDFGNF